MAITASMALSQSTFQFNEQVYGQVTISNSGASAVTVTGAQPKLNFNGASAYSCNSGSQYGRFQNPPPNGTPLTVPAGGSAVYVFPLCIFTPQAQTVANQTWNIACDMYTSDGSVTDSGIATATVTPSLGNP